MVAFMMIVGSIKSLISGSYVSRTRGGNFFVEIAGTEARLLAVFFLLCGLAILACCVLYWIERFRR